MTKLFNAFRVTFVMTGLLFSTSSLAANAFLEIREEHWFEAMEIGGVDSQILYAIALRESGTSFNGMRAYGPWPWVMNITEVGCDSDECHERPHFYSSREAARHVLAAEIEKGNRQIAVGMWQIHLRYNSHYVESPLDLIDPVTNLYVAAMVLRDCGRIYNATYEVLSCYYSGDVDEAGLGYAESVLSLAEKWGKPFQVRRTPANVRFRHDDPTRREEIPESYVAQDMVEDPPAVTLSMLATAKKALVTTSHQAFLKRLEERGVENSHRVIVLD